MVFLYGKDSLKILSDAKLAEQLTRDWGVRILPAYVAKARKFVEKSHGIDPRERAREDIRLANEEMASKLTHEQSEEIEYEPEFLNYIKGFTMYGGDMSKFAERSKDFVEPQDDGGQAAQYLFEKIDFDQL